MSDETHTDTEDSTEPDDARVRALFAIKPKQAERIYRDESMAALAELRLTHRALYERLLRHWTEHRIPNIRKIEEAVRKYVKSLEAAARRKQADEGRLPTPLELARRFHDEVMPSLIRYEEDWLLHRGAAYGAIEDDFVRRHIYEFLEDIGGMPAPKFVSEIVDALKAVALVERNTFHPPCWINDDDRADTFPPHEILPCQNGLLHLPSGTLLPPTANFFTRNGLRLAYDPMAPKPEKWLKFLGEIWGHDSEQIDLLQEVFGYLLVPDNRLQKFFLLKGVRRGGKGTILGMLRQILSPETIMSPKLQDLGNRFGLEKAIGCSVAVVADLKLPAKDTDKESLVSNILRIVGNDPVDVERKNIGGAWTGVLPLRVFIASNEIPALPDTSGAVVARLVGMRMTKSFEGREDPALAAKLAPEAPSVLLWAAEGWRRLHERGHFLLTAESRALGEEMEDRASPLAAFLEDCCEIDPDARVLRDAVWLRFQSYCDRLGMVAAYRDMPTFNAALIDASRERIRKIRPRGDGASRPWYWEGLRLLEVADDKAATDEG